MTKRFLIAGALLLLVAGGLVGFNLFRSAMIAQFFANMPARPATVSTVIAQPQSWTPIITAIGTVNAAQGVDLTVEVAGVVREILFTPGQTVKAGDLLMRLDDAIALAERDAARSASDQAGSDLTRARELAGRGVATDVSLDQTASAAQAAAAQLAKAEAVLAQRRLTAPFNGVVGLARVDPGQYVVPGTVVATLQDLSELRVDFSLPEQSLPQLQLGQKIEVRLDDGQAVYAGSLTGIDPRVDPASRMVALRGTLSGTAGRLTPGQFVRIDVILPQEEGVIALPQTAVSSSLYGDYVYIVAPPVPAEDADPTTAQDADAGATPAAPALEVRQVFVQTGRRSGGLVEVTGIDAGTEVVSAGQNRLSNGQPAIVNNDVNPAAAATGPAVKGQTE